MAKRGPKMTSATGKGRRPESGGFTLFEILIVLAIIALFSGFFLLRFDDGASEEALTRASTDMRGAALKAKKRAYAFRRDQYIVFSKGGFVLTESPPVSEGIAPASGTEKAGGNYNEPFRLPPGLTMELLPPGAKQWTKKVEEVFWTFRSSGLSDPLSVRFSQDRSYTRLEFNVLTALAEEETFIE